MCVGVARCSCVQVETILLHGTAEMKKAVMKIVKSHVVRISTHQYGSVRGARAATSRCSVPPCPALCCRCCCCCCSRNACCCFSCWLGLWSTPSTRVCPAVGVQVVMEMGFTKGWSSDDAWKLFQEFFGKEFALFPVGGPPLALPPFPLFRYES
jgi:hypothetical protein